MPSYSLLALTVVSLESSYQEVTNPLVFRIFRSAREVDNVEVADIGRVLNHDGAIIK